jgi:hypothetical protein
MKHEPAEWTPWNYCDTLTRLARPDAARYDVGSLTENDHLWLKGWYTLSGGKTGRNGYEIA